MASSVLTKSFTNKVKRSASNNISFSNLGGFLRQTFNSISNNFVNARPTMESSFQNVYLLFSNIRRRIEDLRFHEKKIWFPQTNTIFCTAMGKAWGKSLILLLAQPKSNPLWSSNSFDQIQFKSNLDTSNLSKSRMYFGKCWSSWWSCQSLLGSYNIFGSQTRNSST